MTYFSVHVVIPLEHRLRERGFDGKLITNIRASFKFKWLKYVAVAVIGLFFLLHIVHVTKKFASHKTVVSTTFEFENSTTKLPYPGLRLCFPQIFRLYELSEGDLQYLHGRNESVMVTKSPYVRPNLSSLVHYLAVNGKPIDPKAFFLNRFDRFYRVCWQSEMHGFKSKSYASNQKIDLLVDVAEYADIVHWHSPFLRHIEITPFDQYLQMEPDTENSFYLSPGRHSLVSLLTIREDSTIRAVNSVPCRRQIDFDICNKIVRQNFVRENCTIENISVREYGDCVKKLQNVQALCKSSCVRTIFKSLKSEAKLKFEKNLLNLPFSLAQINGIKDRLHRSVEKNSKYNDDYRKPIVTALPKLIKSTSGLIHLLSQNSQMKCSPKLPEINFDFRLPNVRHYYNYLKIVSKTIIELVSRYKKHSVDHYRNSFAKSMAALQSANGRDLYHNWYLSLSHNSVAVDKNKGWHEYIVYHAKRLAIGYEMNGMIRDQQVIFRKFLERGLIRSNLLEDISPHTNFLLSGKESKLILSLTNWELCHFTGGKMLMFTSDWQETSEKYLFVNKTYLISEKVVGRTNLLDWYRTARLKTNTIGIPIFIDHSRHKLVLVPYFAIYHCLFYKNYADVMEKTFGVDRQFSYTNMNAKFKIFPDYTLFVLNNILNSDDRWGLRPEMSQRRCDEESCACNAAVTASVVGPVYLPMNASISDIAAAAKKRTLSNYFARLYRASVDFYNRLGVCMEVNEDYRIATEHFLDYYKRMILKGFDHSVNTLELFSSFYNTERRGSRLREFQYLLKTYGLMHRLKMLNTYLGEVLHGDSFEKMATFLAKRGKIMTGQIQLILHDLDSAYYEYSKYVDRGSTTLAEVQMLVTMKPRSAYNHFLYDIFHSTSRAILRGDIFNISQLSAKLSECVGQGRSHMTQNYKPLRKIMVEWLYQINFFTWRAQKYVASKEMSPSFLASNVIMVSLFYETHDIRIQTNEKKYTWSNYRSDWGSMLGLYYGLEVFNLLQVITLILSVILAKLGRRNASANRPKAVKHVKHKK